MDTNKRTCERATAGFEIFVCILHFVYSIVLLSLDRFKVEGMGPTRTMFVFMLLFSIAGFVAGVYLCGDPRNEQEKRTYKILIGVLVVIFLGLCAFDMLTLVKSNFTRWECLAFFVPSGVMAATSPMLFAAGDIAREKRQLVVTIEKPSRQEQSQSMKEEIQGLAEMRDDGLLTEEQYRAAVDRVIKGK